MEQHLNDYKDFTRKLIPATACTVLLSSGISSFLQGAITSFAPLFPAWAFPLVQVLAASAGLWWVAKNGKKE